MSTKVRLRDRNTLLLYGYIRENLTKLNIPKEIIEICVLWYGLMTEKQIKLKVHSHKGDQHDPPENLFSDTARPYYSKHGTIKDDWIIFEPKDENLFYVPTKIGLRVGFSYQAINEFNILCGNAENVEWIKCHSNTFTTSKVTKIQFFELDCASNIFSIVKTKSYQQYKMEILCNRGDPFYVEAHEFKLFGVEV